MQGPEHHGRSEFDVDALLRDVLRDDLPSEVEARLEARLRASVSYRRVSRNKTGAIWQRVRDALLSPLVPWTPARAALAVAATLLLASGLVSHATVAPSAADESLRRINLSVSLFRALQGASSLRCAGIPDAALDSPAVLAAHVYRRWVPVGTRTGSSGALVASYRSADSAAAYELVLDRATLLPREIRRSNGLAGMGRATCLWTTPTVGSGDEPR